MLRRLTGHAEQALLLILIDVKYKTTFSLEKDKCGGGLLISWL